MKKVLSLLLVMIAAVTLSACGRTETAWNRPNDVLVVGLEADYPPFNWIEQTATDYNRPLQNVPGAFVDGYDVQIAILLGEALGVEVQFMRVAWGGIIESLRHGEIDVIIAGMSPRPDRMEIISFTNAYYSSTHVFIVNENSPFANATSLSDFVGARGVGQTGTIFADLVDIMANEHGAIALTSQASVPAAINLVMQGQADFTIVESPIGVLYQNIPGLRVLFNDVENIFNRPQSELDVAIGVRQIDNGLRIALNMALANISYVQRALIMYEAGNRVPASELPSA